MARWRTIALAAALGLVFGCRKEQPLDAPIRLGFFPNVTHAQALVGYTQGRFAHAVGGKLTVRQFNAGPAAMEALLAGEIDVVYVGSGPAIIAFERSGGRVRIISGSASGGAALVGHAINGPEDLAGKLVAAPQLGNTQDIALRTWLRTKGLRTTDRGGTVRVTTLANPEIVNLYRRGEVDAAWVPEPWAARLMSEGAKLLVDERSLWPGGRFPTTVVLATEDALRRRRADVLALLRVHVELTRRAREHHAEFVEETNGAFEQLTKKRLPQKVIEDAFSRLELTTDPLEPQLGEVARNARALGYLPTADITGIVDGSLLDALGGRAER